MSLCYCWRFIIRDMIWERRYIGASFQYLVSQRSGYCFKRDEHDIENVWIGSLVCDISYAPVLSFALNSYISDGKEVSTYEFIIEKTPRP